MSVWGEGYCNNVNYVKNNKIFKPPSMRTCSSTPPKQNQDVVKEHNMTPLNYSAKLLKCLGWNSNEYLLRPVSVENKFYLP